MSYQLNETAIDCDDMGFILDLSQWSEPLADLIAASDNIVLDERHWEVIFELRKFYAEFEQSPAMRVFSKFLKMNLGADKSSSIYLMQLFGESPAKFACKIAGLPKPRNCL